MSNQTSALMARGLLAESPFARNGEVRVVEAKGRQAAVPIRQQDPA
jgi:hypothetical protein